MSGSIGEKAKAGGRTIAVVAGVLGMLAVSATVGRDGPAIIRLHPIDGTWSHGEGEQLTYFALAREGEPSPVRRVNGLLFGALKKALTQDTTGSALRMAGSWDRPYLELELGGYEYHPPEGVTCSLSGMVGETERSLLKHLLRRRRWDPYQFRAVLRCTGTEPYRMVFEKDYNPRR